MTIWRISLAANLQRASRFHNKKQPENTPYRLINRNPTPEQPLPPYLKRYAHENPFFGDIYF